MTPADTHWDAVVVGAGPAGCIAARSLAQSGRHILLVERAEFPRYKVCGGCLNLRAMSLLEQLDLAHHVHDAPALDSFRLATTRRSVRLTLPGGRAISRATLDERLLDAARDAGAVIQLGARATWNSNVLTLNDNNQTCELRASIVIAAAGLGFRPPDAEPPRIAPNARVGAGTLLNDHAFELLPGEIRMAVGNGGYVGFVRVENNRLNIAAAFDPGFLRARGGPGPAAAEIIARAGHVPPHTILGADWKGTPPLTQNPSAVAGPGWILIGDAAGYVEPFTGEGMAWALESAAAAARLIIESDGANSETIAAAWTRRHRTLFRNARRRCRTISAGLRRPALLTTAVRALEAWPGLAAPVVRRLNEPFRGEGRQ